MIDLDLTAVLTLFSFRCGCTIQYTLERDEHGQPFDFQFISRSICLSCLDAGVYT